VKLEAKDDLISHLTNTIYVHMFISCLILNILL